jgi:hypothetical protein
MLRFLFSILMLLTVAACSAPVRDLERAPVPLGDFQLGHNVVVTPKTEKVPLGRELEKDVMETMLKAAVEERFGRYDGDRLVHFGISIESYFLAPPGVPVVAAPKSAMIILLSVWDDAQNKKLTPEPHQIIAVESIDQGPLVGSGYTKSAEEQFRNLSRNAAKQIETFLVERNEEDGWFTPATGAAASG